MIVFTLILLIWITIGFIGILNCKKSRVIWEMVIFSALVPFIPLLAKIFKVF